jgi:hypothetical protein
MGTVFARRGIFGALLSVGVVMVRPASAQQVVEFAPVEPTLTLLAREGDVPIERVVRLGRRWLRERAVAPRYVPICTGPCTAHLEDGEYKLALAPRGGAPVDAGTVYVAGPSVLHARYDDRRATRTLGLILGVTGTVAGALMMASSVRTETVCDTSSGMCASHENVNGALLAGGIGVVVGAVLLGSVLATRQDEATVTVTPLELASHGALLTLRF